VRHPIRRGVFFALALLLAATPGAASASPATPAPTPPAGASLAAMLRLLPATPLGTGQLDYADYAHQRLAYGLADRPATYAEAQVRLAALRGMTFPFAGDLSAPAWKEAFGFDLWDVDQLLEYRAAETSITVLRGRFDGQALLRAWDGAGYRPQQADGVTYYSLGEDWAFDFADPASSLHSGRFSYFLLLDPGTVVASATLRGAEDIVRVQAGNGAVMADDPTVAAILSALPSDLVTATILDGAWLVPSPDREIIVNNPNIAVATREALATRIVAEDAEAARMPPIAAVLAGFTAGGPSAGSSDASPGPDPADLPTAHAVVIAVLNDAEAAAIAATVAADRLETAAPRSSDLAGRPFVDLFPTRVVRAGPDQPVVLVDLVPAPGVPAAVVRILLLGQDLTFLSWRP
jgi:hypothetical protein